MVRSAILDEIGYVNSRSYRVYPQEQCKGLLDWLCKNFGHRVNQVLGDPFDFEQSGTRYSLETNRVLEQN
jgi:hypothetical protein